MRIVLTSWGSYGDVFPYLGIALALKRQGMTPVLAVPAYYRSIVDAAGIAFEPVGPDVDLADFQLIRRLMDPKRGSEVIIREILAPALTASFADLSRAARDAALVVTHPVTFAGPLVAESLRLPWVSTVLAPLSFFSAHDLPVFPTMPLAVHRQIQRLGPGFARALIGVAKRMTQSWTQPVVELRRRLGLPDTGNPVFEGQFSPRMTLALFSPLFGPPQPDWPPNTRVTGFVFHNGGLRMPPELAEFLDSGEPPIVFTLGTSAVGAAGGFYRESAAAATSLGVRAVLLVGRDPANRPREWLPPDIMLAESAPHEELFPRAAAIVHQGGVGTTGQALRSGRPTLIVPHAHDQRDNAFRVMRLGAARVLYPGRYTAARVARELRTLLDDPALSEAAGRVGDAVRREDGATQAASDLIQFARASMEPVS
jgi:UDP:flavonoid glycosyltransferase YjiC (YdhE family)